MTKMKFLIFGLGSIGRRHFRNLRLLRPDALILGVDPYGEYTLMGPDAIGIDLLYRDWQQGLSDHPDTNGVLICSPHDAHLEQIEASAQTDLPIFCEKPICLLRQTESAKTIIPHITVKAAVGFHYRFHLEFERVKKYATRGFLKFYERNDLASRYGATVAETCANHAVDWALQCYGPAAQAEFHTDGIGLTGKITHRNGYESFYDYNMASSEHISKVEYPGGWLMLGSDDTAYVRELQVWLDWVEGRKKDKRLASLMDGLEVNRVLSNFDDTLYPLYR